MFKGICLSPQSRLKSPTPPASCFYQPTLHNLGVVIKSAELCLWAQHTADPVGMGKQQEVNLSPHQPQVLGQLWQVSGQQAGRVCR